MFGTLVSTDVDRGRLEYIENPDPVAAVSRNLRDKIHISCLFCRSRKVRCSGGRKGCQKCTSMGLECVYPENQGRGKRHEHNRSRRATLQRTTGLSIHSARDELEPDSRNGRAGPDPRDESAEPSEELGLDDLRGISFDDSGLDESLFTPWVMNTPLQHSLDGGSISSSSGTPFSSINLSTRQSSFSVSSPGATAAPPSQLLEPSTLDASLSSLLSPSATDRVDDLESWEWPTTAHDDVIWPMPVDGLDAIGPASQSVSIDSWAKLRTRSDSCSCLLNLISFLERLVSKSASRESRIDLLLASVRNSMETLAIFMACERCAGRAEQNMLLAMATRQISIMCEKTANCYKFLHLRKLGDGNSRPERPELDTSSGPVDISVSTYRVNRRERLHLLKSLVTLQIVEFQQHINTIKTRYRKRPDQAQVDALIEAEKHIKLAQVAISSHP